MPAPPRRAKKPAASTYTAVTTPNATYSWSLLNNTSGATIIESPTGTTGTTVDVKGGANGGYTIQVAVTAGELISTCSTEVKVGAVLTASAVPTNVKCFGGTGSVDLTVSGGTGSYTYSWSNLATTEDLAGVVAGTYSVTVRDASGCSVSASATVTQPAAALAANAVPTNVACFGGNGSVDLTVSGGTGPYTYLWSNGATTEDLASVPAGAYSVTVTDANNCTTLASATVTQPAAALAASSTATAITCAVSTSTVTVSATGGTAPYTGTGTFTRTAGTHSFTVTDANGCPSTTSVTIIEPLCFCSYTQGGWGATPQGNNPARLLSNNFGVAFPSGIEVGIPGAGGFSMTFSSALGVQNYLPAGGTPNALTSDQTNPLNSTAGVFGGQVLALRINVGMSDAGKTTAGYGNLTYIGAGCLSGMKVRDILAAMETALGGGQPPAGCSIPGLNGLATNLNESFDNCQTTAWALANLRR